MEKESPFHPSAERPEKGGEGEGGQSEFERKLDRLEAELEGDPVWQKITDLLCTLPQEMEDVSPDFLVRLNQRIDAYERRKAERRKKTDN